MSKNVKEYNVEAVVVVSKCDKYRIGDKMVFLGSILDKEESNIVCCTALAAIYPLVCALRFGMDPQKWGHEDKIVTQCPDQVCGVTFELKRIE